MSHQWTTPAQDPPNPLERPSKLEICQECALKRRTSFWNDVCYLWPGDGKLDWWMQPEEPPCPCGPSPNVKVAKAAAMLETMELRDGLENPSCGGCGGPHRYDTSVPSAVWNDTVRAINAPEYLCASCVLQLFALAGKSFTARLWGAGMSGTAVEFVVNGERAADLQAVEEENNQLRTEVRALKDALRKACDLDDPHHGANPFPVNQED